MVVFAYIGKGETKQRNAAHSKHNNTDSMVLHRITEQRPEYVTTFKPLLSFVVYSYRSSYFAATVFRWVWQYATLFYFADDTQTLTGELLAQWLFNSRISCGGLTIAPGGLKAKDYVDVPKRSTDFFVHLRWRPTQRLTAKPCVRMGKTVCLSAYSAHHTGNSLAPVFFLLLVSDLTFSSCDGRRCAT